MMHVSETGELQLIGIHLADALTEGSCSMPGDHLNFGLAVNGKYIDGKI